MRVATATIVSRSPAASASPTRCSPSRSSRVSSRVRRAASSRKVLTMAFWRLVTLSISGLTAAILLFEASDRMKAQLLKKLEDELTQLKVELKSELPKEIKRAREL